VRQVEEGGFLYGMGAAVIGGKYDTAQSAEYGNVQRREDGVIEEGGDGGGGEGGGGGGRGTKAGEKGLEEQG